MNLSDPLPSPYDRTAARLAHSRLSRREVVVALVTWLVGALIVLAMIQTADQLDMIPHFPFFAGLYVIAAWFSGGLPVEVQIARAATLLGLIGVALGIECAIVIGVFSGLFSGLGLLLLRRWLPAGPHDPAGLFWTELWIGSAASLALTPALTLHGLVGGNFAHTLRDLPDYGAYILFISIYSATCAALLAGWLSLRGVPPGAYLRRAWPMLVVNSFLPLTFVPLTALAYFEWPGLRPLIMGLFLLSGLLFYATNHAYLSLSGRLSELRALNRIGQALNASLEFDDLLAAIRDELGALLDTSGFYLALYDRAANLVSFPLHYVVGQRVEVCPHPLGNGVTEYILRSGMPLVLQENLDPQVRALGIEPLGRAPRSFVGVPVISRDEVIGVMALRHYDREYAYTDNDIQLVETIAAQTAAAIRNAQLYQQSVRQRNELSSLHRISLVASASLELEAVLRTICDETVNLMPFHKVAIFLVDHAARTMRLVQSRGLSDAFCADALEVDVRTAQRAETIRTGQPTIVEDIQTDERFVDFRPKAEAEGFRAVLDVPLRLGDRIIGSLAAYYEKPRRFARSEVELMQTLSGQIAVAVENARLFEATRARSRELETLYDASTAINSSLSLKNVLRAVGMSLMQALETQSCLVLLPLADRRELGPEIRLVAGALGVEDTDQGLPHDRPRFALGELPSVEGAVRRQAALILARGNPALSEQETRILDAAAVESAVVVPLVSRGELVGLIAAGSPQQAQPFTPDQLRLAEALANQAAVAVENAVLFERTDIALSQRLDEIASLELIAQRMTRRLDLDGVIAQVLQAAAAASEAEFSEVALLDEPGQMLRIAAQHSLYPMPRLGQWPATQGLTGRALHTGQTMLVERVQDDPDYYRVREQVESELVVPILLEGRRLGVINLESTRLGAFTAEHARFVGNLAEHAAIAIQNARLFQAAQRRADEFNILRTIAVELLSSTDIRHTLQTIARGAMEHTHALDVHIYLYNQHTGALTFGTSLWSNGDEDREFAPPRTAGLTATVARSGERLVITQPYEHPLFVSPEIQEQFHQLPAALGAIVGVPLKRGGDVIGVFNIAFDTSIEVNDEMLRYLDFLAAQAAVAIANAELAEATRRSRDLLQALLDSSHDGIVMFDMDQRLVIANSRVEYLMNVRLSDVLGERLPAVMRKILSTSRDSANFIFAEARRIARAIRDNRNQMTRRRYTVGQPAARAIEEISMPVTGQDGEMLGRMFILRDVTQAMELEQFKQEMSHMLVHDLRSPLGGVITGVHTSLEELRENPRPDLAMVTTMLNVAETSARSLLSLVDGLLDINKLEAGEMPLRLADVSLAEIAGRVCRTLDPQAAAGAIQLTLSAPSDLPCLRADESLIERVLTNLVDNAIRYTPLGGRVDIRVEPSGAVHTVTVIDSGDGIPESQRERIFERFVQIDATQRKRGSKGSGLGLTFCKLAVEAHGGRIWVDGGPEGGAAFHFTLPV